MGAAEGGSRGLAAGLHGVAGRPRAGMQPKSVTLPACPKHCPPKVVCHKPASMQLSVESSGFVLSRLNNYQYSNVKACLVQLGAVHGTG